jgi:hypothetical protein
MTGADGCKRTGQSDAQFMTERAIPVKLSISKRWAMAARLAGGADASADLPTHTQSHRVAAI